jgi:hypothetical protein
LPGGCRPCAARGGGIGGHGGEVLMGEWPVSRRRGR